MYTSRSFHNLYATVPTWLVKDMKALLSPFIKLLCNKSLAVGCFPSDFKRAVVRPLLRRADWTPARWRTTDLYRICLSSLSHWRELYRGDCRSFLDSNNLMPETQSAYRQYHSTETAVTKIYNDITTYSWLLIRVMSLLCVYLIWQLPSTPSTMTCWCFDLNVSLVYAVSSSSGSARICQTGHSKLFSEVARRLWLSSLVRCLRVLFLGRVCLYYTWRTLQM